MRKLNDVSDTHFIFGTILQVANKMGTLLDKVLVKHNLTAKQWFLLTTLDHFFDRPPTIKELAKEMGSSHQNVKQIALKLEEKGILKLEKDKKDLRSTRLMVTKKLDDVWRSAEDDAIKFLLEFYRDIEKDQLKSTRALLSQVTRNLALMEDVD